MELWHARAEFDYERFAAGRLCSGGDGGTQSTSSSSTNQQDQRVAATDSAIAVGPDGSIVLNLSNPDGFNALLDAGAGFFEGALEALDKTADLSERNFERVLSFANARSGDAKGAFDASLAAVAETRRTEEQNLGLQVLKSAGPIILVAGIAAAVIYASK